MVNAKTRLAVGRVGEDGRVTFDQANRKMLDRFLLTLKGQDVDVIVRKHQRRRSVPQNNWHWGVAVPLIAGVTGYDPNKDMDCALVHYGLVAKCFGTTWSEALKMDMPNKCSSQLTTEEFSHLMEWEVQYAAEQHGLYIPMPDEVAA